MDIYSHKQDNGRPIFDNNAAKFQLSEPVQALGIFTRIWVKGCL